MKYLYTGPLSAVTLTVDGKFQEVLLHHGRPVDLPEGHDYVKTLAAMGHLKPIAAPGVPTKKSATKGA